MILHCNQNTIYVLNTSYNYGVSFISLLRLKSNLWSFFFMVCQEFDMIGLFGTPAGRSLNSSNSSPSTATTASKAKAKTPQGPEYQCNDKIKESNHNLIKKRPNFLKFFNDSFMRAAPEDASSESSCKR